MCVYSLYIYTGMYVIDSLKALKKKMYILKQVYDGRKLVEFSMFEVCERNDTVPPTD